MILLVTFSHNGCLPMSPSVDKKKKVGGGLGGTVVGAGVLAREILNLSQCHVILHFTIILTSTQE